jgi:hypothetical protein
MLHQAISVALSLVVLGCPLVCTLRAELLSSPDGSQSCCSKETVTSRSSCCEHEAATDVDTSATRRSEPSPIDDHCPGGCDENCLCHGALIDGSTVKVVEQSLLCPAARLLASDLTAERQINIVLAENCRIMVATSPPAYGHALRLSMASLLF